MRMRATALLLVLTVLAGCSGPADTQEAPDAGDGLADEPRSTSEGGTAAQRVLDHEGDFELNNALAATTMAVPANVSTLTAHLVLSTSAPCGVAFSEPADAVQAWVVFTSPSGEESRMDAPVLANVCRVGPLAASVPAQDLALTAEPGAWGVEFRGRGLSMHLHLIVEAS
ncbi:MAG: hypothetical protein AABY18_03390 [Candidatus Thermoplasmatota archaeon]